jgi:UDP-glucose 4-epimerase
MSVLVTGGAGYIGSHTVKELIDNGKDVVVFDNLSYGHRESIKGVKLVVADLNNKKAIDNAIKKYKVDSVIHFAAFIQVGESMENPLIYYQNNVANTLTLLHSMKDNGVKHIVFSSSAAVYGNPVEDPITENCPKNPTSVYGTTKLMMEKIMEDFANAYQMSYIALRYFNASGAHESYKIGEAHHPESHLIPIILEVALGKREFLNIFGNDYPTPDGTCVRDYIHVVDLANAHLLALNHLKNNGKSCAYNLGNGNGFSVLEVVKMAEKITGKKINYKIVDKRPGDPAVLVASSKKIMQDLNWKPRYNSLEKIIETAWNWAKNHPKGYSK